MVEIEKNLDLDFLEQTETQTENVLEWNASKTLVLIVETSGKVSADFEICGKSMLDWVGLATACCKQKIVEDFGENVLETVRPFAEHFDYIAVVYADTPLLQRETFVEIMQDFVVKGYNVLRLPKGFVFKCDYAKTAKMILSSSFETIGQDEFLIVDSAESASQAFEVLNKRILNYHKQNGVFLFGENTIFVDADVEIEGGCKIYSNNVIKGESYIGKNVVLESGNRIVDSIVCDDVVVCQSWIEKSKVENKKLVGPFEKIVNTKI